MWSTVNHNKSLLIYITEGYGNYMMFDDYVFHLTSAILPAPGILKKEGEAACQNNSYSFD